jgi:predicted nucleic acid-binding protein
MRKSFSYTDGTSFAVIERLKIGTALAVDRDFREYGLRCVPEKSHRLKEAEGWS